MPYSRVSRLYSKPLANITRTYSVIARVNIQNRSLILP